MPRITIAQRHALSQDEAGRRLSVLLDRFRAKYGFETRWKSAECLEVTGRGVRGLVELEEGTVRFDLRLSLILSPFRSRIEEGIARNVAGALLSNGA